MTSKLKCPFCNNLLETRNGVMFGCDKCERVGTEKLWRALIQAKQDLRIATKALEDIKSDYKLYSEQGCRMEPNETDMYNYARNALEQIEHKE